MFLVFFLVLLLFFSLIESQIRLLERDDSVRARIAVVGGGIAGSSFVYFAKQAMPNLNITLFEAEDALGGRVDNIEIDDDGILVPIEVGASIFVDANLHMVEFARMFNLSVANKRDPTTTRQQRSSGSFVSEPLAIVGDGVLFRSSPWKVLSLMRAAMAFGVVSPRAADAASAAVLAKWMNAYAATSPFNSVDEMLNVLGLENLTKITFDEHLRAHGVSQSYIDTIASIAGL